MAHVLNPQAHDQIFAKMCRAFPLAQWVRKVSNNGISEVIVLSANANMDLYRYRKSSIAVFFFLAPKLIIE